MTGTLLREQGAAGSSTLHPQAHPVLPGVQAAEDFYHRGPNGQSDRRREIRVISDGSPRRTWLAAYVEEQINGLLQLRSGWDGYRAHPPTDDAVGSAVGLIFAIAGDDLTLPPHLFPLQDGGIQLEWHVAGEGVEIEVDAAGESHALTTNAIGEVILDQELVPAQPEELDAIRAAVRRLSARLGGAR